MLNLLRTISRNIRSLKYRDVSEEKFNGYGFMRRVYGVEAMPNFQTILKLARTDTLTGLFNRVAFDDIIEREVHLVTRYNSSLSLVLVNINYFTRINDKFDHITCDDLLCEFAAFLSDNVRKADIIFRWSGDEFLIVMTHTNAYQAELFCDLIEGRIGKHTFPSVGVISSCASSVEVNHKQDIDFFLSHLMTIHRKKKEQRDIDTAPLEEG